MRIAVVVIKSGGGSLIGGRNMWPVVIGGSHMARNKSRDAYDRLGKGQSVRS